MVGDCVVKAPHGAMVQGSPSTLKEHSQTLPSEEDGQKDAERLPR